MQYPGRPDDLNCVAAVLEAARRRDTSEFAMLADVLRDPVRGYPLLSDDPTVRCYALLGSWSLPDASIVIGLASVTETSGKAVDQRLAVTFEALRSQPLAVLVARFEEFFLTIEPAGRIGDRHRDRASALLWVGDSGRAGATGGGWKTAISAISESRGLTLELSDQPSAFHVTHRHISRFAGRTVAIWRSGAGALANRSALPPRWRDHAIYLEEPGFAESLDELRRHLDQSSVPVDDASIGVETWDQFFERVEELQHEGFVLTAACRASLKYNAYPDPPRMWDFIRRLSQAAREWRDRGGEVGDRLADWIAEHYEIEVAVHDSTLGTWADFTFEGRTYSREPHVKVDDFKNPAECGRIYFAQDNEARRFIVDHIGLHP